MKKQKKNKPKTVTTCDRKPEAESFFVISNRILKDGKLLDAYKRIKRKREIIKWLCVFLLATMTVMTGSAMYSHFAPSTQEEQTEDVGDEITDQQETQEQDKEGEESHVKADEKKEGVLSSISLLVTITSIVALLDMVVLIVLLVLIGKKTKKKEKLEDEKIGEEVRKIEADLFQRGGARAVKKRIDSFKKYRLERIQKEKERLSTELYGGLGVMISVAGIMISNFLETISQDEKINIFMFVLLIFVIFLLLGWAKEPEDDEEQVRKSIDKKLYEKTVKILEEQGVI